MIKIFNQKKASKFIFGFFLLLSFGINSYASTGSVIERVEPPNWWIGFNNTNLQLLIHGRNISRYGVVLDYAGVSLKSVDRTSNPNYLFINLNIQHSAEPGQLSLTFNDKQGNHFSYPYHLKSREKGSASRKGFDSSDVMYLITPDRFANGNPANDIVKGMQEGLNRTDKEGRHGGDIAGISQHLDYIKDLGFTAIWSTPLLENNMSRSSYHGYAITDFYKIDPRFGSTEEYRMLSVEARKKGLGLIMDMVVNHIGSNHWWVSDLPTEDWLNFNDHQYLQNNHRRETLNDPYAAKQDKKAFTDGWYWKTMPDLNQGNPYLATYLIQNAIWWIEYADLVGIRMDTYSYPDKHFMAGWSKSIIDEYPKFNIVGEIYTNNRPLIASFQSGKSHSDGYVSSLPSVMDFPLQEALVKALTEQEDWAHGWTFLYTALTQDWQYADPANLVIFADNHDMQRIFTQLNEDMDLLKMAMAYTFTMRGIPQMYYGTELLKSSPGVKDDGIIRSDFPGGWSADVSNGFTGVGLTAQQKSMTLFIKKLLNWRKNTTVIHHGKLMHFIPEQGSYVYFRYNESDRVMVVFNKNQQALDLSVDRFSQMLPKNSRWKDVINNQIMTMGKTITVPARSVLILEKI